MRFAVYTPGSFLTLIFVVFANGILVSDAALPEVRELLDRTWMGLINEALSAIPRAQEESRTGLAHLAVHAAPHAARLRRELGLDPGPHRAEGVETLGARPLPVFLLEVARRHVVHAGEAEDVAERVLPRDRLAALSDDEFEASQSPHPYPPIGLPIPPRGAPSIASPVSKRLCNRSRMMSVGSDR